MSRKQQNRIFFASENAWVNVMILCVVAGLVGLSIWYQKVSSVGEVNVNIEAIKGDKYLITDKEVKQLFKQNIGYDLHRSFVGELDLLGLEKVLLRDGRVDKCEIYIDKHFDINIDIKQKAPVVRVEMKDGESYYLDEYGAYISTYLKSAIRVPVATGYLQTYRDDFMMLENHNLKDLLSLANHIKDDDFLAALVEQIDVKQNGEILVIPKLGRQRILLGSIEDMEDKFDNLKIYYKKVVSKEGMDRFEELNLKYKGRIFGVGEES